MAIDNVPRKRRVFSEDFIRRMNELVLSVPDYGHAIDLLSTDTTIQEGINYTTLSATGVISSLTIPVGDTPSSLIITKPGWIHVDGRNGVVVNIDGLPVCRANTLVRPVNEYSYAVGLFPVKSGMTLTWTVPTGAYLTLRYVPFTSL